MKFRFKVDQAACLRAGIDCPNSIVSIDVNPSELPQEDRDLIADRLYEGINVCPKVVSSDGKVTLETFKTGVGIVLIMGGRPDLDGLLTAVYNNEIVCDLCQGLTGNTFWDMEARIREKV